MAVGDESDLRFAVFSHIAEKESVSIHERLKEFADEARLADSLGYDYFFTTEHHFSKRFSLSPSQPISLTVIAQNTERIRFGPMVVILPVSEPLRVAEEMLILDHMSGGRLDVGLGRGIRPHEHISYGIETHTDQERFLEGLEFLLKAFTTDARFSWRGRHHRYFDVALPWRPYQRPHPPIWAPTNTPATAEEWGRRGYGTGGFALLGMELYEKVFDAYRAGCEQSGVPTDDQRIGYLASVVVADTDDEARRLAHEHFPKQIALFEYEASRSYEMVDTAMQAAISRSFRRFDEVTSDLGRSEEQLNFICGSPSTVVEKLERVRERLGINTFMGEFSFGELPYDRVARSLELFSEKVVPRFRTA